MTLPYEEKNALIATERFLLSISNSAIIKRIPANVRDDAWLLLRHFPTKRRTEEIFKTLEEGK
jgi:hypothetical protein